MSNLFPIASLKRINSHDYNYKYIDPIYLPDQRLTITNGRYSNTIPFSLTAILAATMCSMESVSENRLK